MILDIARHKFYEAFLWLALFAVVAVIMGSAGVEGGATSAPLGAMLADFEASHTVLAAVASLLIFMRASMLLARGTVRSHIYTANTLATMPLSGIALLGLATYGPMLPTLVVALLVAESLARLFYAYGSARRMHAIFSSMLALGTMPLVDSSMLALVALFPLILLSLRISAREAVAAIIGVVFPMFAYSYVVWCSGGSFVEGAEELYNSMAMGVGIDIQSYLTLPRIILLGVMLFVQLFASLFYIGDRVSMTLKARHIWVTMQSALLLVVALFALVPSLSVASFVVVAMLSTTMQPLFFQHFGINIGSLLFVLMFICAVWAA
ncbi:MAG: hypothetical protein II288_00640 [Alistipes sp.]|nr:hypothetical protein [Alistipes sp.]